MFISWVNETRKPYTASMDEITIGDKTFVSSKRAAKITGYAKDYVGQLCREGRVEARLVGRNWYVLDSSIREHRFGKEGEDSGAPETGPEQASEAGSIASTWERPQYEAEVPVLVPNLEARRAPAPEQPKVVAPADMQSAWRQWFEEKPQKTLPDGSEDFTEESLPVIIPEAPRAAPAYEAVAMTEAAPEEETVPISRIQEAFAEAYAPEEEPEEAVELHRSYASRTTGEQVPGPSSMVVDLSEAETPKRVRKVKVAKVRSEGGAGPAVVRAMFLVAAMVAVLVAIVGTGSAEKFLAGTSVDFGAQKSIVDYLGGTSSYEKTK